MAERYKKALASVINSEPDTPSGYSTRNKKRKLNEMESDPTTFHPPSSYTSPKSPQTPRKSVGPGMSHHVTIHSSNLGKALKAILSENPRMKNAERTNEVNGQSIQVPLSVDEESHNTIVVAGGSGSLPSVSVSSPSRDTTPSSSTLAQLGDIHPFIQFIEQERGHGKLSQDLKAKAWKMLRDWQTEYSAEEKRIRALKRKIRDLSRPPSQSSPPPAPKSKRRDKSQTKSTRVSESPSVENDKVQKQVEEETVEVQEKSTEAFVTPTRPAPRRDSVTGPNGLTGSYWDISTSEMGRGSRRKIQKDPEL